MMKGGIKEMEDHDLVILLIGLIPFIVLYFWIDYKDDQKRFEKGLKQERKWRQKILENQLEMQEREEFYKNRSKRARTVFFMPKQRKEGGEGK